MPNNDLATTEWTLFPQMFRLGLSVCVKLVTTRKAEGSKPQPSQIALLSYRSAMCPRHPREGGRETGEPLSAIAPVFYCPFLSKCPMCAYPSTTDGHEGFHLSLSPSLASFTPICVQVTPLDGNQALQGLNH